MKTKQKNSDITLCLQGQLLLTILLFSYSRVTVEGLIFVHETILTMIC